MATNFYQAPSGPQMSQQPAGPHFVQSNNASAAMTAMAATNKYFNNNSINNNQTAATQSPLMNHAYNAQSMQQQAPSLPISTVPETPPNMQHLINYAQMPTLNVHKRPVQEENSSEVGEDDVFDWRPNLDDLSSWPDLTQQFKALAMKRTQFLAICLYISKVDFAA